MMARISVGTVTPVPKGDYSATTTYNRLNWVKYNGALYCCKANGVVGVSPENTEFWMKQLDAPTDADGVNYDNSTSGLEATKVQGAIDEVVADLGKTTTALNGTISATQEMISDEWISTKTYAVGEYCIHSNKLWKCLVQNSNVTPTEGTYWTKVNVGDELKERNVKITPIHLVYTILSPTTFSYTGVPIDIPPKTMISITVTGMFNSSPNREIAVGNSDINPYSIPFVKGSGGVVNSCTVTLYNPENYTNHLYVWGVWDSIEANQIVINGYKIENL